MPEYLSPGVYVEEVDAGPKPIAPVATSTAGMVGVTERGPVESRPRLLTSFADFQRLYGGYLPLPGQGLQDAWEVLGGRWWLTAESVQAFFEEGGARLFFQRVTASGATAAGITYNDGLVAVLDGDVAPDATLLRLSHTIGITDNAAIVLASGSGTVLAQRTVTAVDPAQRTVALDRPVGVSARRDVDMVVIPPPGPAQPAAPRPDVLRVTAASAGRWGDALSVRVVPSVSARLALAVAGPALRTTVVGTVAAGATTVIVAAPTGLDATTPIANHRLQVGAVSVPITRVGAAAGGLALTLGTAFARQIVGGTPVRVLRPAAGPGGPTVVVRGAGRLYPSALVELEGAAGRQVLSVVRVDDGVVTLSGSPERVYVEDDSLSLVEAEVTARYAPAGGEVVTERHGGLRLADDGNPNHIVTALERRSTLVRAERGPGFVPTDLRRFPTATALWNQLSGGDDVLDSLVPSDFVGTVDAEDNRTGVQALESVDQIAICAVPGVWSTDVRNALIVHCETLADRFAVLDPPPGLTVQQVLEFRSPIETTFAALYYPWLRRRDVRRPDDLIVPPSAFIAGIYARVDVAQGVHKAPANETIRSIRGFERAITKRQQDLLNPESINVLREFPGRGNLVWGARVITDDAAWRYVSVRRLFLMVEESIDEATQWAVFEGNDTQLWARVRLSVTNFLQTLWRSGALQGATEAEAFFVTCDRSTMSQDDIDNGRLICLIGIAPVKPAEFVIFRIQQKTLELTPA